MLVRTVFQNVERGAGGGRWDKLARRISGAFDEGPPDLVLLSECENWSAGDPTMLSRAADDLGMAALPLPYSRSGLPVAILYRRETMGEVADVCDDFSDRFTHGVLTACWNISGLPRPFGAAVTHLDPFSPDAARKEAQYLGFTARRYEPYVLIGADFNYPPLYGPDPDLSRMSVLNIARRYKDPLADPPRVRNTDVAQQLANDHFNDAFARLHKLTGDPQFTARTGKSDRIDWIMVRRAPPRRRQRAAARHPRGRCRPPWRRRDDRHRADPRRNHYRLRRKKRQHER